MPESEFSLVMDTIIKPVLTTIESEYRLKKTSGYDTSEYKGLFSKFLQRHKRETQLEHNQELSINDMGDTGASRTINNEINDDEYRLGMPSSSQDTQAPDILKTQVTEPDYKCYEELSSILQCGHFVEPGVSLKFQLYPNLVNLINSLQAKDDFIVIKVIAKNGIEKNAQIKDENRNRDAEQLDKRLIVFKAIEQANSLEEALDAIKQELPESINEPDDTLRN